MIYLCDCGKFHENYPCLLCDECLTTADGKLWDKIKPKDISEEDDVAIGDDDFVFEDESHYICFYCHYPGCDGSCIDIQLPSHETNEHLEIT